MGKLTMSKIYKLYVSNFDGTPHEKISFVLVWILTLAAIAGIIVGILYATKVLGGSGGDDPIILLPLSQAQIEAKKVILNNYKTVFEALNYSETPTSSISATTIDSLSGFVINKVALARESAVNTSKINNAFDVAKKAAIDSILADLTNITVTTISGQTEAKYVNAFINAFKL